MSQDLLKYSVGIDVSQKHLENCFVQLDKQLQTKICGTRKLPNTPRGHAELLSWIDKHRKDKDLPLQIVLEATGVYHETVAYLLHQKGYQVCIVLPNKAKKYMQSLGLRSKTDRIDAKGLARMGAEQQLEAWHPISAYIYEIRGLLRHREGLVNTKTVLTNQLHAQKHMQAPNAFVIRQLKELLATLEAQIKEAEKAIKKTTQQDQAFYQKVCTIADSIKGMGWLSVLTLVAETNGFKLFRNQRQLTKYAGYDVVERQSGKFAGKPRISKQGNAHIRRTLYMPALNVVRYQVGPFKTFFDRIFQRSFIKMKAYVAVQRKLLCLVYTLWKKEEIFNPNYHKPKQVAAKEVAPI